MITEESVIAIGKIYKPHGFKGEMNVDIYYGPELFNNPKTPFFVKIENILVPFFVKSIGGGVSGTSFLKLKGIDSDIDAVQFANKDLYALKSFVAEVLQITEAELAIETEGLTGYKIIDSETGNEIGTVEDIENGVEYDYLLVRQKEGEIAHIPFIDEFIEKIIDPVKEENGEIYVTLPEGLLEL